jgi:hypothetical protein
MDAATAEKKYNRLYQLTWKVRHHQIRWFKFKTSVDLDKARDYERQLDKLLKEEEKQKISQQKELF